MLSLAAFLMVLSWQRGVPVEPTLLQAPATAPASAPGWSIWRGAWERSTAHQVRIEEHIILRVSPRRIPAPEAMRPFTNAAEPMRFAERRMDRCIPVSRIGAVRPDGNGRLLLFMRDRQLVAADLERSCSARDFYSGFYVEQNDDGRLCVHRDKILARSGSRCEIAALHRLVPDDD